MCIGLESAVVKDKGNILVIHQLYSRQMDHVNQYVQTLTAVVLDMWLKTVIGLEEESKVSFHQILVVAGNNSNNAQYTKVYLTNINKLHKNSHQDPSIW